MCRAEEAGRFLMTLSLTSQLSETIEGIGDAREGVCLGGDYEGRREMSSADRDSPHAILTRARAPSPRQSNRRSPSEIAMSTDVTRPELTSSQCRIDHPVGVHTVIQMRDGRQRFFARFPCPRDVAGGRAANARFG